MSFTILGISVTAIGAIFTAIGAYIDSKRESELQTRIIESQGKNQELSDEIIHLTQDLLRPELNVIAGRVYGEGEGMGASIYVSNTGGSTCKNVRLVYERHPSPMKESFSIRQYEILPKSQKIQLNIPFFKDPMTGRFKFSSEIEERYRAFYSSVNEGRMGLLIQFHIEYEYQDSTLSSMSYTMLKSNEESRIDIFLTD